MTPLERNRLLSALANNGFHAECSTFDDWVAADATFAPGRCYVTNRPQTEDFLVATSLPQVGNALAAEGFEPYVGSPAPPEMAGAFRAGGDTEFHRLVRRVYQLSCALPTAPLDTFRSRTRELPTRTEAERWVVQRIGQDIFRAALIEYWSGRCAATGIDQLELLRASHCKPWAQSTDDERLDVRNGLLLVADMDAAFDCGLISFDESGVAVKSSLLRETVGPRFANLHIQPASLLTSGHQGYLAWHRKNRFRP